MSLEELALEIQAGDRDGILTLWDGVRRFAVKMARRWVAAAGDRNGVSVDDLLQESFLALLDALEGWRADDGSSFIGWYGLRLKAAFTAACGLRTHRQAQEPLRNSTSLSVPIGDAESDLTLEDVVSDPRADQDFLDVETRLWREQLHTAMEKALAQLPADERTVIRARFYDGMTQADAGQAMGLSAQEARRLEGKALTSLRRPKISGDLRQFVEARTPFFMRVGVETFQRTGESAVERIVFLREQLERGAAHELPEEA